MKTIINTSLMLVLGTFLLITGCSKKTVDDNTPGNNQTGGSNVTTPTFSDGYGTLAAVNVISYQSVGGFDIPITLGTAVAAFHASGGSSTLVDGGTVTCNGKTLTKQSGNGYVYENLTDPLNFTGAISWTVSGSTDVPSFSYTDDKEMPGYSGFSTLPSAITRSAGLTIDLSGKISGADSVYVVVISTSGGYIIRHLGADASQAVFTAAELGTLSATSSGIIEVCPWNYKSEDFSSKKFYFVNESAYTKSGVTIN